MIDTTSSSYEVTKDPRFLAFCDLATEGSADRIITDENRLSMGFSDFCEMLEKGEIVDPQNRQNIPLYEKADWDFRVKMGTGDLDLATQILDIMKKCYDLGMVNKDNMLLRKQAAEAYKSSIRVTSTCHSIFSYRCQGG